MIRRATALGWVIGALLAYPIGRAAAEAPGREQELAAIRLEIQRLQARLQRVQGEATESAGALERVTLELELQERQAAEATAALALAEQRLAGTRQAIAASESQLATARAALQERLLGLYRLGRPGYLRLFLSLDADAELLPAIRELRFLARRDAGLLDRYARARARLASERDELAAREREARAWLEREESRRRDLAAARERHRVTLARVERERRDLAGRFDALAEREKKLANFLDFLYGRVDAVVSGRPMQEFRGVLDWPVAGTVVTRFGPRLDPRYGTRTPHRGVDLATAAGAAVKAVYPGKVAYAAPFEGYGQTVIVQHPGRVFTLYAGLARLGVAKGDVVTLHAALGEATERLYFEIRVENRPEDPLAWLR